MSTGNTRNYGKYFMTLGETLKIMAIEKGFLTQSAVAIATGLTRSFVSRLFADARPNLSGATVLKLARGFGVPMDLFAPFVGGAKPKKKGKRS